MTPGQRGEILAAAIPLCEQGLSGEQIAARVGWSRSVVNRLLLEAGVKRPLTIRALPPTKPCACGRADCIATRRAGEMASDWERRQYANLVCLRDGQKHPIDKAAVRRLRDAGCTQREIADELGMSRQQVQRACRLLDTSSRDRTGGARAPHELPDYRWMNLLRVQREPIGDTGRWA